MITSCIARHIMCTRRTTRCFEGTLRCSSGAHPDPLRDRMRTHLVRTMYVRVSPRCASGERVHRGVCARTRRTSSGPSTRRAKSFLDRASPAATPQGQQYRRRRLHRRRPTPPDHPQRGLRRGFGGSFTGNSSDPAPLHPQNHPHRHLTGVYGGLLGVGRRHFGRNRTHRRRRTPLLHPDPAQIAAGETSPTPFRGTPRPFRGEKGVPPGDIGAHNPPLTPIPVTLGG